MFDLLKKTYYNIENLRGKKLYIFLAVTFVLFIGMGLVIGYFTTPELNQNETITPENRSGNKSDWNAVELRGKVIYVDPTFYPNEDISYRLMDQTGKQIALLKMSDPSDRSLEVVEGLTVTIKGIRSTLNGTKEEVVSVSPGGVILSKDATN
jgi:hypothetical protein